jgi:hypothetical protein
MFAPIDALHRRIWLVRPKRSSLGKFARHLVNGETKLMRAFPYLQISEIFHQHSPLLAKC